MENQHHLLFCQSNRSLKGLLVVLGLGLGGCKKNETAEHTSSETTDESDTNEPMIAKVDCSQAREVEVENLSYERAVLLCQDSIAAKGIGLVGNLTIKGITASSLEELSCLCAITGNLQIYGNDHLVDLHGLENLESVSGALSIGAEILANGLLEEDSPGNASLKSLHGLEHLSLIKNSKNNHYGLVIHSNEQLINLEGLTFLSEIGNGILISENSGLTSLQGLSTSLTSVYRLNIENNDGLSNLEGLEVISSIGNELTISGNNGLTSLQGLSAELTSVRNLTISGQGQLEDLKGLQGISFMGNLAIVDNSGLASLEGLEYLSSLGSLIILENSGLTNLHGLSPELTSLTSDDFNLYGGVLYIAGNDALTNLEGLGFISAIEQEIVITENNSLTSLYGLSPELTSLAEGITISDNDALVNLKGLEAISSLGSIRIKGNDSLTSLEGLSPEMTSITRHGAYLYGGNLMIINNDALGDFSGLPASLILIENYLYIADNDALTSLGNLSQLNTVNKIIIENNPFLTSVGDLGTSLTFIGEEYRAVCNPILAEEEALKVIQNLNLPLPSELVTIDANLCE